MSLPETPLPVVLYVDAQATARLELEAVVRSLTEVRGKSPLRAIGVGSAAAAREALAQSAPALLIVAQRTMNDALLEELCEEVRRTHPEVVRVGAVTHAGLDAAVRAQKAGLIARCALLPWTHAELVDLLLWGIDAHALNTSDNAGHDAIMQRLLACERLAMLGTFASAVIHDFNQPVAYIFANSERLRQLAEAVPVVSRLVAAHRHELTAEEIQVTQELVDELPEIVLDMIEGCRLMQSISGTMRGVLCPTAPALKCDPEAVARFALAVCKESATAARARLQYEDVGPVAPVAIPAADLTQVLCELVHNATLAIADRQRGGSSGDERAAARPQGGVVTIVIKEAGEDAVIEVRDDGCGMSSVVQAHAGKPFFSTRPQGTGLGLWQTRRLLERIGGSLAITSTPGAGTTVSVTLRKA